MKKTFYKQWLLNGILLFCSIFIATISIEIALHFSHDSALQKFKETMRVKKNDAAAVLKHMSGGTAASIHFGYHPFYGYTKNPPYNKLGQKPGKYYVDNYGFRNNFDYRKKGDIKQIGIFGGSSTFGDNVSNDNTIAVLLEALINKNSPEKYRIINFGVGGWHLPQQLFAMIREAPYLDGVIFLDGVNELAFTTGKKLSYPIDFPTFNAMSLFFSDKHDLDEIKLLYKSQANFPIDSWLSSSRLFLFLSKHYYDRAEKQAQEAENVRIANVSYHMPEYRKNPPDLDFKKQLQNALNLYEHYSLSADAIADKLQLKMLHVLQPQMYANSTAQEVAIGLGKDINYIHSTFGKWYFNYDKIQQLYVKLWGGGQGSLSQRALDLATLLPAPSNFAWSDLWSDPVHPVHGGNKIIAQKIYEKIVENSWIPKFKLLPSRTILDHDNNAVEKAHLKVPPSLTNKTYLNRTYTWLYQGQPIGIGKQFITEPLPIGRHKFDLRVQTGEGMPKYFRQPIILQNSLSTLLNYAKNGIPNSNDANSKPELANDGNIHGRSLDEVWYTSKNTSSFFWQIDLQRPRKIKAIEIFFREDFKNAGQISNLILSGSLDKKFKQSTVLAESGNMAFPVDRWVTYTSGSKYRYIRVSRKDDNYLVLAEVRILGE
jgi:hypothetical protein